MTPAALRAPARAALERREGRTVTFTPDELLLAAVEPMQLPPLQT